MRYLTFLILMVSTSLYAGSIHKWVDENGNVHYGDAPPAKTKTENVRVQSAPSNPGKALPRLTIPDDSDSGGAAGDGTQQAEASPEQAVQICEAAKGDLETIATSDRIQLQTTDGQIRYLDEAEIEERRAQAQAEVDKFCQ